MRKCIDFKSALALMGVRRGRGKGGPCLPWLAKIVCFFTLFLRKIVSFWCFLVKYYVFAPPLEKSLRTAMLALVLFYLKVSYSNLN